MLKELLAHDKLGSYSEICYVLQVIKTSKKKNKLEIINFCLEDSNYYRLPINGILSLLNFIKFIKCYENKIKLTKEAEDFLKYNIKKTESKSFIANIILEKIINNDELRQSIDLNLFEYDNYFQTFVINNNNFPLKLSSIRNLLINFELIEYNNELNKLLLIDECFIKILSEQITNLKRLKTIDQLKKELLLKQKYGDEAEKFVLEFEKIRLKGHPELKKIKIISKISVNAGYDIISFEDTKSNITNRFIEVKSYNEIPKFHWMRNQIEIAYKLKDRYYIYLVNRKKIKEKEYCPIIVKNPYKNIFLNEEQWKKECNEWLMIKNLKN